MDMVKHGSPSKATFHIIQDFKETHFTTPEQQDDSEPQPTCANKEANLKYTQM